MALGTATCKALLRSSRASLFSSWSGCVGSPPDLSIPLSMLRKSSPSGSQLADQQRLELVRRITGDRGGDRGGLGHPHPWQVLGTLMDVLAPRLRVRGPETSPGHMHDHRRVNVFIALPCRLQG